jgi:hypothetical protein
MADENLDPRRAFERQEPSSTEGKRTRRRNALKQGLPGVEPNPADELQAERDAELVAFVARHEPRDAYELGIVKRAAFYSLQARWIRRSLDARAKMAARHGEDFVEDRRALRAIADFERMLRRALKELKQVRKLPPIDERSDPPAAPPPRSDDPAWSWLYASRPPEPEDPRPRRPDNDPPS